ncbi:hypothetical protein H6P81_001583 [Aristolochia fimbriata]|uniref:Uncharacterized protein n=1 Tax=Aristolochia fimbriata TaxID=158543 RepID=A0AAV7FA05_ARIFI|nr:hypothetical protein H6P81_001583 [Aristolochia fimbriata]
MTTLLPFPFMLITLEGTHHGPVVNTPTMFVEIGSTEEYLKRQDAAQAIAQAADVRRRKTQTVPAKKRVAWNDQTRSNNRETGGDELSTLPPKTTQNDGDELLTLCDALIKTDNLQLSDANVKLADKQAALEKLQWEVANANSKAAKLQEDLDSMEGESATIMGIAGRRSVAYAKEHPSEETIAMAAEARVRLRSLLFTSNSRKRGDAVLGKRTMWLKRVMDPMYFLPKCLFNRVFVEACTGVSLCQAISPGKPENPGPSDDGHLPDLPQNGVPPQDAERAPVVRPGDEGVGQHHREAELVPQGGHGVQALGPSDQLRAALGGDGEGVVDREHGSEQGHHGVVGGGEVEGLRHPRDGGVGSPDDVVHVELEIRHPGF